MQFLESSVIGLRSARHEMTSQSFAPKVVLYPMAHVGQADFYADVYQQAQTHDFVMYEGVGSKVVTNLTRSYRWLGVERLGLIVQPKLPPTDNAQNRILADITPAEFDALWAEIPFSQRAFFVIVSPIYGLCHRIGLTRRKLARGLDKDDLSSRNDIMVWSDWSDRFLTLIHATRDTHLCNALRNLLLKNQKTPVTVGIIYGAGHMPAVTRCLHEIGGYRASDSKWMTIFGT